MLMALSIFLEGKEYISASRASKNCYFFSSFLSFLALLLVRYWYWFCDLQTHFVFAITIGGGSMANGI